MLLSRVRMIKSIIRPLHMCGGGRPVLRWAACWFPDRYYADSIALHVIANLLWHHHRNCSPTFYYFERNNIKNVSTPRLTSPRRIESGRHYGAMAKRIFKPRYFVFGAVLAAGFTAYLWHIIKKSTEEWLIGLFKCLFVPGEIEEGSIGHRFVMDSSVVKIDSVRYFIDASHWCKLELDIHVVTTTLSRDSKRLWHILGILVEDLIKTELSKIVRVLQILAYFDWHQ